MNSDFSTIVEKWLEDKEKFDGYDPYRPATGVWFYKPFRFHGKGIQFGNAQGCVRTLLIGTYWTGCVVFALWQMKYDPDCPGCTGSPYRKENFD